MKSSEAKKLIGREVWIKRNIDWQARSCRILSVAGKNIQVDHFGSTDWYWLPDCRIFTEKPDYSKLRPEYLG
jgi:hypothetical protein